MPKIHAVLIGLQCCHSSCFLLQIYAEYGKRDRERYRRELHEYNRRTKAAQPSGVLRIKERTEPVQPRGVPRIKERTEVGDGW